MTKRICLFAGYSPHNIVEDYVIYYLKELSLYADIYYCADCNMPQSELKKMEPYVKLSIATRHKKYDFGSWGLLYKKIANIDDYDELILANDSVFGPLYPLDETFKKMDNKDLSAWALCFNKFLMSFFVVLKKDIFMTDWFAEFITTIKTDIDKSDVIRLYEKGLTQIIEKHHLKYDALFTKNNLHTQFQQNHSILKTNLKTLPFRFRFLQRWRTNKIRLYEDDFFIIFLLGMPFIKKQAYAFSTNHFHILAPLFIKKFSHYDYTLIQKAIDLNNIYPKYTPFYKKLVYTLKSIFFKKIYRSKGIVYYVFGIEIYTKKYELV